MNGMAPHLEHGIPRVTVRFQEVRDLPMPAEPASKLLKLNSSLPRWSQQNANCQKKCQKNFGFETIPPLFRHNSAEGELSATKVA